MDSQPTLPVPISLVEGKYLIFDVDTMSYLRRAHRICGVMTGSLPQNPSQNVFLGLPVQIMPEEAQLLVEKGVGYLVDDARTHDQNIHAFNSVRHADYIASVKYKAEQASKIRTGLKEEQKKVALSKQKTNKKQSKLPSPQTDPSPPYQDQVANNIHEERTSAVLATESSVNTDEPLFEPLSRSHATSLSQTNPLTKEANNQDQLRPLFTPTTSTPLIIPAPSPNLQQVPNLPKSYPLYRHLNSKSYFTTPGLRFGCQYCVYPGDPLRFHSHFLATSYEWEEEIDFMDLVGGGRLGTGVKKGFLIGGVEKSGPAQNPNSDTQSQEKVRTYSIEWAAM